MVDFGLDSGAMSDAERRPGDVAAVVELHIEQGPLLEERGLPIGIVTEIVGNVRVPLGIRG